MQLSLGTYQRNSVKAGCEQNEPDMCLNLNLDYPDIAVRKSASERHPVSGWNDSVKVVIVDVGKEHLCGGTEAAISVWLLKLKSKLGGRLNRVFI